MDGKDNLVDVLLLKEVNGLEQVVLGDTISAAVLQEGGDVLHLLEGHGALVDLDRVGDHIVHDIAQQGPILEGGGERAFGEGLTSHIGDPVLGLLLGHGVVLGSLLHNRKIEK